MGKRKRGHDPCRLRIPKVGEEWGYKGDSNHNNDVAGGSHGQNVRSGAFDARGLLRPVRLATDCGRRCPPPPGGGGGGGAHRVLGSAEPPPRRSPYIRQQSPSKSWRPGAVLDGNRNNTRSLEDRPGGTAPATHSHTCACSVASRWTSSSCSSSARRTCTCSSNCPSTSDNWDRDSFRRFIRCSRWWTGMRPLLSGLFSGLLAGFSGVTIGDGVWCSASSARTCPSPMQSSSTFRSASARLRLRCSRRQSAWSCSDCRITTRT